MKKILNPVYRQCIVMGLCHDLPGVPVYDDQWVVCSSNTNHLYERHHDQDNWEMAIVHTGVVSVKGLRRWGSSFVEII